MLPLYSLTITSNLVKLHPRTIMNYEKLGFFTPARARGNKRLFSNEDLKTILLIRYLHEEKKLNMSAIKLLFEKGLISSLFPEFDSARKIREILEEV